MTLADAVVGSRLRVVGRGHTRSGGNGGSIASLGIHVGEEVVVVRAAPFRGPILVEVPSSGVRIALGRGMAEAVMVELADAAA